MKVEDFQIVYHSPAKRKNFLVKIGRGKAFKTMANLTKEDAIALRGHLQKSEQMAAYVNKKIKP